MTRLYVLLQDLRAGIPISPVETFTLYWVGIKSLVMFLYTAATILKSIRQRMFVWELIATIAFWIGWVGLLIVESISRSISAGFGMYGSYEHLVAYAPIYLIAAVYAVFASWFLPIRYIVNFIKRKRKKI